MLLPFQIAAKISNPTPEAAAEAAALKRPFEGSSGIVLQPVWFALHPLQYANQRGRLGPPHQLCITQHKPFSHCHSKINLN